jgi:hypothetical protein
MFNMPSRIDRDHDHDAQTSLPLPALPQGQERIPSSDLLGESGAQQSAV